MVIFLENDSNIKLSDLVRSWSRAHLPHVLSASSGVLCPWWLTLWLRCSVQPLDVPCFAQATYVHISAPHSSVTSFRALILEYLLEEALPVFPHKCHIVRSLSWRLNRSTDTPNLCPCFIFLYKISGWHPSYAFVYCLFSHEHIISRSPWALEGHLPTKDSVFGEGINDKQITYSKDLNRFLFKRKVLVFKT